MANEYYYYGQGRVFSMALKPGAKWRWWGDVSALTLALELESAEHVESYSGNKGIARRFPISKKLTATAKVHQLDTAGLAEVMYGAVSDIAAGAVAGEALPTVAAGDTVMLEHGNVSALTLVDSAGTPASLSDANYVLDPRFGVIDFTTVPGGLTQPFKAAYTRGAGKQVNFLTQPQPVVLFRYLGINLAEGNAPVMVEVYRMATDPLKELALINDGTTLAGADISLSALIDTSKSATGPLGQFGRMIQYAAAA